MNWIILGILTIAVAWLYQKTRYLEQKIREQELLSAEFRNSFRGTIDPDLPPKREV